MKLAKHVNPIFCKLSEGLGAGYKGQTFFKNEENQKYLFPYCITAFSLNRSKKIHTAVVLVLVLLYSLLSVFRSIFSKKTWLQTSEIKAWGVESGEM